MSCAVSVFFLLIPPPLLKVFTYCGSQHIVFESQSGTRGASSLNIFFAVIAPAQMYMYGLGFPISGTNASLGVGFVACSVGIENEQVSVWPNLKLHK